MFSDSCTQRTDAGVKACGILFMWIIGISICVMIVLSLLLAERPVNSTIATVVNTSEHTVWIQFCDPNMNLTSQCIKCDDFELYRADCHADSKYRVWPRYSTQIECVRDSLVGTQSRVWFTSASRDDGVVWIGASSWCESRTLSYISDVAVLIVHISMWIILLIFVAIGVLCIMAICGIIEWTMKSNGWM